MSDDELEITTDWLKSIGFKNRKHFVYAMLPKLGIELPPTVYKIENMRSVFKRWMHIREGWKGQSWDVHFVDFVNKSVKSHSDIGTAQPFSIRTRGQLRQLLTIAGVQVDNSR